MDALFSSLLRKLGNERHDVLASDPKVVTITLTSWLISSFDGEAIVVNLDELRRNPDIVIRTEQRRKRNVAAYVGFSNSVTVVFNETKTIKVFRNGRLHVTGCKTIGEAQEHAASLIAAMPTWQGVEYTPFSIVTLNTCVRTKGICISLDALQTVLKTRGITSRYNPDIYQALVAKAECSTGRKISAMIFYTGTIIIAGVKTPTELEETFNTIMPYVTHLDVRIS